MLVCYHWGCSVGHTYALDTPPVPVVETTQVEEHENDVSNHEVGLLGDVTNRSLCPWKPSGKPQEPAGKPVGKPHDIHKTIPTYGTCHDMHV